MPRALLLVPALLLACEAAPAPVAIDRAAVDSVRGAEPDSAALAAASEPSAPEPDVQGVRRARAEVAPVGDGASGTVSLTRVDGGVRVLAELTGLSQSGFHALQVLAARTCDGDPAVHLGDGPHGGPYSPPGARHAGDLGNVRGDRGRGRYDRVDAVLPLDGTGSAVGRAVVVRAGRDDAASADGAAGAVIGCGIIGAAS